MGTAPIPVIRLPSRSHRCRFGLLPPEIVRFLLERNRGLLVREVNIRHDAESFVFPRPRVTAVSRPEQFVLQSTDGFRVRAAAAIRFPRPG
jgi:hypothetical protein